MTALFSWHFQCLYCAVLGLAFSTAARAAEKPPPAPPPSPLSAVDALKYFQLDDKLAIEIAAAEPEVIDPVAIRFDEDGRLWVAEMHDYPLGALPAAAGGKRTEKDAAPLSRIKVLEDKDHDGRFETATLFADKLSFVTGLQPWQGGVIVTLAGRVAYLKDASGDGRADVDETWFTGFAESNSQLRANHPTLALDNHIYIANGLRGGAVVNHLKKLRWKEQGKPAPDEPPINISGMDFRFHPLTGDAEAVSGNGQFGLCFDDWGNRFVCSNRNPCQQIVLENRYLQQAPSVAIPTVVQDVAAASEQSRIFPISQAWTTSNLHAGQFTAACGVLIYRGDLLPEEFRGNVFTCDPTGNLIHREIMAPAGSTFISQPAYEGKEFLASTDEWFRPVSMELGPDGALYVVDMYRAVIEHPEWVPDELKNRPDERLGDDRGRIYRIVPKTGVPQERRASPQLSRATDAQLLALLENANAWQRETAQRLIVQRQAKTLGPALAAARQKPASPLGRLHALWTEMGLGTISESALLEAEPDLNSQVSRQQIIAIESLSPAKAAERAARTFIDNNMKVRLQVTLAIAGQPADLLGNQFFPCRDIWLRRAIVLAASRDARKYVCQTVASEKWSRREYAADDGELLRELVRQAVTADGAVAAEAVLELLSRKDCSLRDTRLILAVFNGIGDGLSRQGGSLESLLNTLQMRNAALPDLKRTTTTALFFLKQQETPPEVRSLAIEFLGNSGQGLGDLVELATQAGGEIGDRRQALAALARRPELEPWRKIIANYGSELPALRQTIFDGALAKPERVVLLLDELTADRIKPSEFDPVQTNRLLVHADAKIHARAVQIFGAATPTDRKEALDKYQESLKLAGDAQRGLASFAKNCSTCHKIGATGVNVAPDISDSRTKTPAQLLGDIIQPNRAIDANYVAYQLLLKDGTIAAGVLTSETSTSVTLKQPGAKIITVPRTEIETLKSTGVSLMPDGLEKNIPPQEMADLLAFIKNWRYLDGRVPAQLPGK